MDDDDPFYFGQDLQDAACFGEDYLMSQLGLVVLPVPPAGSAFEAYQRREPTLLGSLTTSRRRSSGGDNLQRRVFRYYLTMRRIGLGHDDAAASTGPAVVPPPPAPAAAAAAPQAPRSSRFRHIMRERLRRERLSQGFADLHALLPPGASSKGGKNDIVGAAAGYIRELGARKERLRARNEVLLQRAASHRWRNAGPCMVVKVRAESEGHSTVAVVDAFETVLRQLKAIEELQVTAIRSSFCAGSMWMDVRVEGQIPAGEVDKAITNALVELQGNEFGKQDPGSSKPSFSCQVESGVPMG